jgi:alkanesulfonate monooxygenase SsuD/methylene tetrahydromethanopterin reductase-like flavin-dependent oxidoreductase (luciferase family)
MKFHWFHLMPYPDLPDDFREKYRSVWVDVPSHLYDPERGHQIYNDYLDELEYAAEVGFDGICVNEHHQNAYGLMPSPNLMAAALARRASDAAIVVLGNSLALYNPPTRIAEEMAMLDVMSGGRLVAGFPVGTSMDTNYAYGQAPVTLREKYREAHDLIMRAWSEPEPFAFNGKYTQLRYVNTWPKPIQKPHPPIWVPGGGSIETWEWITDMDYLFAYLSYAGYKRAKTIMDGFWEHVAERGKDPNPYRAGFLQFVAVSEDDAQAEEDYAEAAEYFFERSMHVYRGFAEAPGYRSLRSIAAGLRTQIGENRPSGAGAGGLFGQPRAWKDYISDGTIIAGSPQSVTEQLHDLSDQLRVGHLMLLLQFGNMPKDKAMKNTRMFAEHVMPNLRNIWSDWHDDWWIKPLARQQVPRTIQAGAV